MKSETKLHEKFMSGVASKNRVVPNVMQGCVKQPKRLDDYDNYLLGKIEASRASMNVGVGFSNEDVEALFAARRNQAMEGSTDGF